jgi:outer membrane protein TolC
LKAFIGLKSEQELTLSLTEAHQQLVGRFDPGAATLEQTKNRSFELKSMDVRKDLQKYNVLVAKARLAPNFHFGVLNADPFSIVKSQNMFYYVGISMPVWDGFKRWRNISRQKTILKQQDNASSMKGMELEEKWDEIQENLRSAAAAKKAAQAQEELARLRQRQSEIRYQSGGEPLTVYLEGRKVLLDAQKNTIMKARDYDLAVLGLRHFTGDLGATYVDQSSWQQQ